MVLEPLAAGEAVLTPDERELGVVLADIGGGTTEIAVWRHGALAHTSVLPVGGDHFTNDLAVVLKTPVPDAERLKRKYGAAMAALVAESESLDVPLTGGRGVHPVKRREIAEILQPRAEELLTLLWEESVREVPAGELRAGLVLTGGGAELDGLLEVAEQVLGVAVRTGRAARPRRADGRHRLAGVGLRGGSPALRPRQRRRVEEALARRRRRASSRRLKGSLKNLFPASTAL